jgi:hypothetical protein
VAGGSPMGEQRFGADDLGLRPTLSGATVSANVADGLALEARLGYRLSRWVAVEARGLAHGNHLFSTEARERGLHAHVGARLWPLAAWRPDGLFGRVTPSVALGVGATTTAARYLEGVDPVGFRGPSVRVAASATMELGHGVALALSYDWQLARLSTFTQSFAEGLRFPIEPPLYASYHSVLLGALF